MKAFIKGNLKGFLCDNCFEDLSNTKVLLYQTIPDSNVTAAAVASSKETFHPVNDEEVKARKKLLIATSLTDEAGNFSFEVSEKNLGEAFDVDFICGNVPHGPKLPKRGVQPQFHITTIYPKWRSDENENLFYTWDYAISSKWWCQIRGYYFDAWVICGVLVDCKTGAPLAGINVSAMDSDFITDDFLGSAVTDSSGYFRINYTSVDFKKTFLSPVFNIETDKDFPFFSSGPDVYFKLDIGGTPVVFETAANRRKNVGYCLCVRLCVSDLVIGEPAIPASFTRIGRAARFGIVSEINPATGKTMRPDYDNYAFFSSLVLVGSLSKKLNNQPMEYMFEYQEVVSPGSPLLPGSWQPVTPGMIPKTVIGYLWTMTGDPINPIATEDYYINGNGAIEKTVDFNGNWIQMPQDLNFAPHIDTDILTLNTESLMPIVHIDVNAMTIGSATIPGVATHVSNKYFALRMKQRQWGNAATEVIAGTSRPIAIFNARYDKVPKYGSWIPTKVDNQMCVCSLDINEIILGTGGCGKITNNLTVHINARNENLGGVSLTLTGPAKPGQSFSFPTIASTQPEVFGNTIHPIIVPVNSVNELLPCAYTVTLSVSLMLTTGDHIPNPLYDFISFCKV